MKDLFLNYLHAGLAGSIIILIVFLLRLLLRKAPRKIICLLWLIAALRLLLPFQIESSFSLQPQIPQLSTLQISNQVSDSVPSPSISVDTTVTPIVPVQSGDLSANPKPATGFLDVLSIIWLSIAGIAVLYMCFSYFRLKHFVRNAEKHSDGAYECSNLQTAFVLGYWNPNIYLPQQLDSPDRHYIIAHEHTHIARGDNWWKLLAFFCVCLHWYNPLAWLGFVLLCRDIEAACDEAVISNLDLQGRKAYSIALLNCGKRLSGYTLCPVSFGEISLRQRIKSVLSYKKPTLWITILAVLAAAVVCICFLTSPNDPNTVNPEKPQTSAPEVTQPEATSSTEPPVEEPTEKSTEPVEEPTDSPAEEPTEAPTEPPVEPTSPPPQPPKSEPTEKPDESNETDALAVADASITRYAASLGFQTLDTHPNTNVKRFSSTVYKSFFEKEGSKIFIEQGKQHVDAAYQYCLDKNADIENSIIWVNVIFVFSGNCYRVDVYCATAYSNT